ncbi:MAG: hypothetical protein QOG42_885 [Solirubrobacteraceae bacterium]|nr:hypothetical protein [Solirubrobacteraceae bacterium]
MHPARLRHLVVGCTLGLAVVAGAAPANGAQKPRSACQKLAGHHRDLARSAKLVTVVRGDDETGRISACVLPRGKVRTLASWDDGLSRDSASVVATAGTWVLVEEGHGDQYGGISRSLARYEVRSGRRLPLAGYGCQIGYADHGCPDGTNFGAVVLASSGAGAYELTDLASATTTLLAFSPAGAFSTLADGPVQALRVTSTQIAWTQGGVAYAAPLPG